MSRLAQVCLVLTAVCWTAAATVAYTPEPPGVAAKDLTPLWLLGAFGLLLAITVDARIIRRWLSRVAWLRPGTARLAQVIREGNRLRDRIMADGRPEEAEGRELAAAWYRTAQDLVGTYWEDYLPSFQRNQISITLSASGMPQWAVEVARWLEDRLARLGELQARIG